MGQSGMYGPSLSQILHRLLQPGVLALEILHPSRLIPYSLRQRQ